MPVPVSGLTGVTTIAAGADHGLALLSNGTVMAWGSNLDDQLGDGENGESASSDVPVPVSELSVVRPSSRRLAQPCPAEQRNRHGLGENFGGELGDGTKSESDVPVAVSALSGVASIAAGDEDSFAVLENDTVMAWGFNGSGQVGDGQKGRETNSAVPVPVVA